MDWIRAGALGVIATISACGQTASDTADSDVGVGSGGGDAAGRGSDASTTGGARGLGGGPSGGTAGAAGTAGTPGGTGGTGGVSCDGYSTSCPDDEYCGCDGFCHDAPDSCPTECDLLCGCAGGAFCNPCIAKLSGHDTNGGGLSGCTSDGGAPGFDGGASAYCWSTANCANGLKCCYSCETPDNCYPKCALPDSTGECPPVDFGG